MKKTPQEPRQKGRSRTEVTNFLDGLRASRLCGYMGQRCDCKYGYDPGYWRAHQGERNGCPEMRCVVALFECMTDREFAQLKKRVSKKGDFFFHL